MVRALGVLLLLGLSGVAWGDEPLPGPLYDLTGPRSAALGGAERASGTTNDAIWLNPAAITDTQRYTVTLDGFFDLRGNAEQAGLSVADSTTGPVAAGIAAHRVWVGPSGAKTAANVFNLSLAGQLGDFVTVGAGGKMLHTRAADGSHNHFTPDLGLFVKAAPVQIGMVAYNLVAPDPLLAPRQYAVAANVTLPKLPTVEGDVVFDTSTHSDISLAYHVGAELAVIPLLSLRAGYLEDRILNQRAVSGGLGFYVPPGFGMDITYKHELLGAQAARVLMVGINLGI